MSTIFCTGETTQRQVTDVFVRESDHINYLTIADENGNIQVIETTDGHPFWVVTDEPDLSRAANDYSDGMYHGPLEVTANGYWVEAKNLREGDVFLGANGRTPPTGARSAPTVKKKGVKPAHTVLSKLGNFAKIPAWKKLVRVPTF